MLHALIVEDNPVNYMVMRNQLARFGVTAAICQHGREAAEYCTRNSLPDLILLDGYMPEMDGIEFLKWIRSHPGGNRPYILFCSSSIDRVDASEALRQGAECHYPKPIPAEALRMAIDEAKKRTNTTQAV